MQTIVEISPSSQEYEQDLHLENEKNKKEHETIELQTIIPATLPAQQKGNDSEGNEGLESKVANEIFLSVATEAIDSYYKSRQSHCKEIPS